MENSDHIEDEQVKFKKLDEIIKALPNCQNTLSEIQASLETLKKIPLEGKEHTVFEIFCKKQDLDLNISLSRGFLFELGIEISEDFLSSLSTHTVKLKEKLESVSFNETSLEEKRKISLDKEKEIEMSFSAVEFDKLNEEKEELDNEIFRISNFINDVKKEISKNEEKLSVLLELKKKFSVESDVIEKMSREYEKINLDLNSLCCSCSILEKETIIELLNKFISRTFSKKITLLEKWIASGEKAIIIHYFNWGNFLAPHFMIWKEWTEKDEKMMKWFLFSLKQIPTHISKPRGEAINLEMTVLK